MYNTFVDVIEEKQVLYCMTDQATTTKEKQFKRNVISAEKPTETVNQQSICYLINHPVPVIAKKRCIGKQLM